MSDQVDTDIVFAAADEAEGVDALSVSLGSFEGPLHLLLELARAKKFDLTKVSVTEIADQYLAFIAEARARNIEIAGDYLVMASWLTLLKSRLLLPAPHRAEDAPDPDYLASALRQKLLNLEQARIAARRLDDLPQLERDIFLNASPEPVQLTRSTRWQASLHDLLAAYCAERTKKVKKRAYQAQPRRIYPLETARKRLEEELPALAEWRGLNDLAPVSTGAPDAPPPVSYLASTFAAALELAKEDKMELRQAAQMAPLFLRAKPHEAQSEAE